MITHQKCHCVNILWKHNKQPYNSFASSISRYLVQKYCDIRFSPYPVPGFTSSLILALNVQYYPTVKRLPVLRGTLGDRLVQLYPDKWTGQKTNKNTVGKHEPLKHFFFYFSARQQIFSSPKMVFEGESVNWGISCQTVASHCSRWPVI